MEVLHVGAFPFPTGHGSQLHLRTSVTGLAARGHRVAVACYAAGEGAVPAAVEVLRAPAVPGARFLGSGPHWSRPIQDLGLREVVRRRLGARPPDVIHAHNVEAAIVCRAARGRSGPPIVLDAHTRMAEELPQWFPRAPGAGTIGAWADGAAARASDAVLVLSEGARSAWRAAGCARVDYLPPAIDPSELAGGDAARARRRWDLGDRPWVLYAGNLDPYQDVPDLLAAVRDIPALGVLVVSPSGVAALCQRARALGLPPERLRAVETTRRDDLVDALAAATLAAVPRRVCSGFPMKLLNLLSAGLPVVCAPGSARPIAGVVAVDGVPAMTAALAALAADPAARAALGAAARAAIAAEWTIDTRVRRLESFYAALCAGREGGRKAR